MRVSKISHAHYLCINLQYTIYFKCTVYVQAENTHQNICVCVCACMRERVCFRLYDMNITYLQKWNVHTRVFIKQTHVDLEMEVQEMIPAKGSVWCDAGSVA